MAALTAQVTRKKPTMTQTTIMMIMLISSPVNQKQTANHVTYKTNTNSMQVTLVFTRATLC